MTDKMEKQTVQKLFEYMKTNPSNQRPYPPPSPYDSYYPPMMPPQTNPYPEPSFPSQSDKSKIPYPYSEYYKHHPYYQNYNIPKPNNQMPDPSPHYPINSTSRPSPMSHQELNPSNTQNSMYSMGMQHANPYNYGYPYYGYPGVPYPYSMYPPYYYNRGMSDMYGSQQAANPNSYLSPQSQMMAPPHPYYNHPSYPPLKHTSSIVKQEIVISSDQERGRYEKNWNREQYNFNQKPARQTQKRQIQKKIDLPEPMPKLLITEKNLIKQRKIDNNHAVHQNQVENKNNDQEQLHPFVIKRKRISKEEKEEKAIRKRERQFLKDIKDQHGLQGLGRKKRVTINKELIQKEKQDKEEKQEKEERYQKYQNEEKQQNKPQLNSLSKEKQSVVSSRYYESKQNASAQKQQSKKNIKNKMETLIQPPSAMSNEKEDKKMQPEQCSQDKQNLKKDKVKDDHPLKQLRYSESHGRIRIGNYFQSVIPDILHGDCKHVVTQLFYCFESNCKENWQSVRFQQLLFDFMLTFTIKQI